MFELPLISDPHIKDVWAANMDAEMAVIRNLLADFPFVAMDTEFPGVVARPVGSFKNSSDYHYQVLFGSQRRLDAMSIC